MKKHLTCRALGMKCGFEVHDENTCVVGINFATKAAAQLFIEQYPALRIVALRSIQTDPCDPARDIGNLLI